MGDEGAGSTTDLRATVAAGCRILAQHGLAHEVLGHVSARVPGTTSMWIRCRGADERGVRTTTPEAIRRVGFDGTGEAGGGYQPPLELPIHGQLLARRPEVGAVVHAHPPYTVLCGLAGVTLEPLYGAFDPAAAELTAAGIATYPRSRLIDDLDSASELVDAMAGRDVCLMLGHGVTVTGATVEEAVLRALHIERLAWFTWQLVAAGVPPRPIGDADRAFFAERPGGGLARGAQWAWQAYLAEDADGAGFTGGRPV